MSAGTCIVGVWGEDHQPHRCGKPAVSAGVAGGSGSSGNSGGGEQFLFCEEHAAELEKLTRHRHLDWSDMEAVRRWVIDMRMVADDLDAVVADMLRPARQRELGRATHATKYREARHAIVSMLSYAFPPPGLDLGAAAGGGAR